MTNTLTETPVSNLRTLGADAYHQNIDTLSPNNGIPFDAVTTDADYLTINTTLRDIKASIDNLERRSMLSEKQITTRSTRETIEDIYSRDDISIQTSLDANRGYPFDYPIRWLNDPSQAKRIGIRRLECTPNACTFKLTVSCYDSNNQLVQTNTRRMDITSDNNTVEILHAFCDTFVPRGVGGAEIGDIAFDYDDNLANLQIWYFDANGGVGNIVINGTNLLGSYNSVSDFLVTEVDYVEFFKLLNQNMDIDNMDKYDPLVHQLVNPANFGQANYIVDTNNVINNMLDWGLYPHFRELYRTMSICGNAANNGLSRVLDNVWNRKRLYFHASFSTAHRKFIGKSGDFYAIPNLLFPAPTNETTFYIQVSQDGRRKLMIYYANIDVQLCFITNVDKTYAIP